MNTEGWMAWKMSTVVAPILSRINRAHSTNHEEDNLILGKWRNLGARLHGWNNEWPISIITLFLASDLESIVKKSSSALLDIFSKFFASWEELWCSKNLKLPYPNWGVKTIFYWAWHVSLIGGWSYGKKNWELSYIARSQCLEMTKKVSCLEIAQTLKFRVFLVFPKND